MNEEILNDFFSFMAREKEYINLKDFEDIEKFLLKTEFEDIYNDFMDFLNEFLYWNVQKLDVKQQINSIDETHINKIV